jgi:hypothetical protein
MGYGRRIDELRQQKMQDVTAFVGGFRGFEKKENTVTKRSEVLPETDLYPFESEWAERQSEQIPALGIDWDQRLGQCSSPLAIGNLPERKNETLLTGKEME